MREYEVKVFVEGYLFYDVMAEDEESAIREAKVKLCNHEKPDSTMLGYVEQEATPKLSRQEIIKKNIEFLKSRGFSDEDFSFDGSISIDKPTYKEWKNNNLDFGIGE